MGRIPEFYPTKQGRPYSPPATSYETGLTQAQATTVYLQEENVALQELLDKLLNEQIQKLQQMLIELKQMKLHLAGLSGENIEPDDVDD